MEFLKIKRYINALRLAKKAFGGYKKQIVVLLSLGFLGAILEGVGINAIIPLFSFLDGTYLKSEDFIIRFTRDFFNFLHIPFTLKFLLIFIAALFIFKAVAVLFSKYLTEKIHASYIRDTQMKLLRKTLEASWPYLSKQKIGYLDKVLTNDISIGASLLSQISGVVILLLNVIMYLAIAFNLARNATFITLIVGTLLFFFFKPIAYRIRKIATRKNELMKIGTNHIDESMVGIKTVKALALEERVLIKAAEFFEEWKQISIRLSYLANFANVLIQPVSVMLVLGLFAFTYKTGNFAFASFAVIIYAINKIFAYIQQAQIQLQNVNENYPYLKSVVAYEEEARGFSEKTTGDKEFLYSNSLALENVSFRYEQDRQTLTSINLNIEKGKMLGIIGPSGSGKTTLVDMLLRLIKPESGMILLDGVSISDINMKQWREKVGYVAQDNFLINDTVRNNIKFYSDKISDEDMIEAAKLANIYDFIMSLPNGFDSEVGERGTSLSGGQRQRIVMARVLARKPQILVLDEATSALDNESQSLIQEAIERLRGNVTVIIIAHRPSAVMNVDELIVLDAGKIIEKGRPVTMLEDSNSYFHKTFYSF
jgi:ATP-binding cassette subfamily C protein